MKNLFAFTDAGKQYTLFTVLVQSQLKASDHYLLSRQIERFTENCADIQPLADYDFCCESSLFSAITTALLNLAGVDTIVVYGTFQRECTNILA